MKTHITCHPARSESTTQRSPLSGYLAGAAGLSALFAVPQAEAAVTAVTFGFGPTYTAADGSSFSWAVTPDLGTLRGFANASYVILGVNPAYGSGAVYQTSSLSSVQGRAQFFTSGTIIGAGGNGGVGSAYFQSPNALIDFTSDQLNQDIAFKTSTNNWGWANVSWTEADKTLAINSAYVESVAGNSITVGDVGAVPEPSRALLALAGLAAVGLRRRRKQAAY